MMPGHDGYSRDGSRLEYRAFHTWTHAGLPTPVRPVRHLSVCYAIVSESSPLTGCLSPAAPMNMCTLQDDGEIRFKTGATALSGITSRVADNPGLEQLIVTRIVCVTVNPQCRLVSLDNVLQPARECKSDAGACVDHRASATGALRRWSDSPTPRIFLRPAPRQSLPWRLPAGTRTRQRSFW